MSLNIAITSKKRKNTHQICPHIQWNSFRFNQLMVPIHGMDSFKSPSLLIHSRRQALKSSIQPYKVASNLAITTWCAAFHWPSLSELNDEFALFLWANDNKFQKIYSHGFNYQAPCGSYGTASCGSCSLYPKDSSHSPPYGRHH